MLEERVVSTSEKEQESESIGKNRYKDYLAEVYHHKYLQVGINRLDHEQLTPKAVYQEYIRKGLPVIVDLSSSETYRQFQERFQGNKVREMIIDEQDRE